MARDTRRAACPRTSECLDGVARDLVIAGDDRLQLLTERRRDRALVLCGDVEHLCHQAERVLLRRRGQHGAHAFAVARVRILQLA